MTDNRLHRSIITILVFTLLAGVLPNAVLAQSAQPTQTDDHLIWTFDGGIEVYQEGEITPGEILVGLHRNRVSAAGLNAQLGMEAIESLDLRGLDGETGDAGVNGYVMRVPVGMEWETIERLQSDPSIAFAVPNWVVHAAEAAAIDQADAIEQDDHAATETAFSVNDTLYAEKQWYQQRISASRAWQLALNERTDDDPIIRVAVIDSGVYADHVDLEPHLRYGKNYLNPGEPPDDDYGHGTHIAGVIAATLNNGQGIAGLAPWVELDIYKILDSNGRGDISDLATAIRDATDNDADIINLSLQYNFDNPVVDSAVRMAAVSNVLLIGAAGNCGSCATQYPAIYTDVMAVGATDYNDQRASYSARGPEVMAPGGTQFISNDDQILSTWSLHADATCSTGLILENGNPYCNSAGTSMAAGVVTGLAALIWGIEPSFVNEDVRRILNVTAVPLDGEETGSGRIDAEAAIRSLLARELVPSSAQLSMRSTNGSAPFIKTLALTNDSRNQVAWSAHLASDKPWVSLTGNNLGSVRFGEPAYVSVAITPTLMTEIIDDNQLRISTDLGDGGTTTSVNIFLDLLQKFTFFPLMNEQSVTSSDTSGAMADFKWAQPASPGDREILVLFDGSSLDVDLPIDFPIGEDTYNRVRVHADGFLTFPSDDLTAFPSAYCTASPDRPENAILGWMAELNPGQGNAQVSGFPTNASQYVVEFLDVPTSSGVAPAYEVSFQIILDEDGDVRLSYLDVPDDYDIPPEAAVGIEAVHSRFRNVIFCADGVTTLGITPRPRQTLQFTPGDIY